MASKNPKGKSKSLSQTGNDFFRLLFDNHPVPMWIYDLKSLAFLEVNNAAIEKYGYTRKEFLGLTLKNIRPSEDVARLEEDLKQERPALQHSGEWRHRLKDGQVIDVEITSHTLKFEEREAALVMAQDVTERKRAQDRLLQSEERTRLIIDAALDAVVTMDADSVIIGWNPQATQIFGWSRQEAVGQFMYDLIIPEQYREAHKRGMAHYLETGEGPVLNKRFEITALHRDGHEFPVELAISPLKLEEAQIFSGFIRDISERKEMEEKLRESDAQNRALFESAQKRLSQTTALRRIDKAISSSLDLKFTLDVVLNQAISELNVDAASILLYNQSAHILEFFAGQGFRTPNAHEARVPLGKGFAGRAVLERRRISIPDVREPQKEFLSPPDFSLEDFVDYHAVPLLAKGKVLGVLEIFNRSAFEPTDDWLDYLETLAGQAAIAIENLSLIDDLQQANDKLVLAYDAAIEGWSRALDLRDHETEDHTKRVTNLTLELARDLGVKDEDLVHVRRGALLHDIGKMGVSDTILLKEGKLTEKEWQIMKQHPVHARNLLSPIIYLHQALDIPYCHHEKWDGTGYPQGLKGQQIPFVARIFAVVDVYDALTSDRPYRKAWPEKKAISHIKEQAGSHFDPQVVEAFLKRIEEKGG